MRRASFALMTIAALAAFAASAADVTQVHPAITAAVESKDRPEADRQRDAGRKPALVLEFFGVRPGMTVLEYVATGGNTAEILSRIVGPKGKVYMQNSPAYFERPQGAKQVEERLANNRLPNVQRLDKPPEDLGLPANSLDGAIMNLVFHDMYWISKDVPGVLKNLYTALKPGGFVGVADHAAPKGTGAGYAQTRDGQHRIDEEYTKQVFKDAGFVLDGELDALRNPADDRQKAFFAPEWRDSKDQFTDRFVLRFRKPK
jgi:predicted methyltransferase